MVKIYYEYINQKYCKNILNKMFYLILYFSTNNNLFFFKMMLLKKIQIISSI